ncbi:MAG TPA: Arc family DNA binding domain-containing protein [Ruminiclostridium sp.]
MAEKKSILLRLSPRVWEEICKWADDEFRSVNGQIEYLISDALREKNKTAHSKRDSNVEDTKQDNK